MKTFFKKNLSRTIVVVCPGVHSPDLTQAFLAGLEVQQVNPLPMDYLVYPTRSYPAYSSLHLIQFLHDRLHSHDLLVSSKQPILLVAFSAGVVAAIGAALTWQVLGGQVRGLIAIDGWGVPLAGDFPIHRVSHDRFTHWSSVLLGAGADSFYADPEVEHLELWRSPHLTEGWQISAIASEAPRRINAASFLTALIRRYGEN